MGSLAGSIASSPLSIDLTAQGTSDWLHYFDPGGAGVGPILERKSTGGSQLGVSSIGTIDYASSYPGTITASWTDGTPDAANPDDRGVRYTQNAGTPSGFTVTAPADTNSRTIKFYGGGLSVTSLAFSASLSDSSATPYAVTETTDDEYEVTITYAAASSGQTLTVTVIDAIGDALVTFRGATLSGGGAAPANPPFDRQPTVLAVRRIRAVTQTEASPQLGVKTGTGLPDVQGRGTPMFRRVPMPRFEALPPRVSVAAPPSVNSQVDTERLYVPRSPAQTEVPPQLGVFTGTGLPDVQGRAAPAFTRVPMPAQSDLPPLVAAAPAPPAVDSPVAAPVRPLRGVLATGDTLPPVTAAPALAPPEPSQFRRAVVAMFPVRQPDVAPPPKPAPPVPGQPLIARMWQRVRQIIHDVWWPQTVPIALPFQPAPFTIQPVDVVLSLSPADSTGTIVDVDVVLTITEAVL